MHVTNKARPAFAAEAASGAGMGVTAPSSAAEAVLSIPLNRGDGSSADFMNSNSDGHGRYLSFTADVLGGLMA